MPAFDMSGAFTGDVDLSYTPAGAAALRPVQTKLDETPSDADFGVVADGVTDDSAATQDFLDYITDIGGFARMVPGPRLFAAQVVLDRLGRDNSLTIEADGVTIKTDGAISAFKIAGGSVPYATRIVGLNVSDDNVDAVAAFEQAQTANVTWENCSATSNGDVYDGSGYAGWWLHQSDEEDADTGCFWTRFPGSFVRRTGSDPLPVAVRLEGACNATDFYGFGFSGVVDGILLTNPAGSLNYLSNGVNVIGAWIEGITGKAIRVIGDSGQQCPGGLAIGFNRLEAIATLLSMEGCTISAYEPPQLTVRHLAPDVVTLVNNPNGLELNLDLSSEARTEKSRAVSGAGFVLRELASGADVLDLDAGNVGGGLRFRVNGTSLGRLRPYASGKLEMTGDSNYEWHIRNLRGISSTGTHSENLSGYVTIGGGGSASVSFPVAEADASYGVMLGLLSTTRAAVSFENRGTGGFTIYGPAGAVIFWLLVR
jgi:hypothetical protein